ncbi:ABC transporter permease [Salinilacihabitans rarus]|uniref:ABC transporter permease n=1 Tax=Salinilacihabitans rarus TaxID=2961596 RepID=UPI0020C91F62|nr:ABC transporter permease [Salinilacihabitans rarus]
MSTNEFDERTLRERIAENPKPALLWLLGALVLVALEFGRAAAGFLRVAGATRYGIETTATLPSQVQASLAESAGSVVGWVGFLVTALLLLALVAIVVKWLFVPISLVDRLGIEASTGVEDVLERALVTVLLGVLVALVVATPLGGVVDAVIARLAAGLEAASDLPTLTSRQTIPNEGYRAVDGGWEGTAFGLSPAWAWALRVAVIYAYAFVWLGWLWKGYEIFREHYREADWTPRDDSINRLRNHYWGVFGLLVVFMFVVMALWAQPLSPYTAEANIYSPYEHEFTHLDGDDYQTLTHGEANIMTRSQGGDSNVGMLSYDQYDRYHPFGTNQDGKDLFTFVAYGARVSLVIGVLATALMAFAATALALITAYYKGLVDLVTVVTADSVISLPRFLLVLLLSVVFKEANHPIATIYDGGILLALIFAATGWPLLWRAVRGPALQIAGQEWVDAARSYGQSPVATMQKHMSPYIAGYMLVYASLSLGGVIIGVAALSFLGLGVEAPTPEWGRAVYEGRSYVSTASWHISTLPGILVVLVVTGFNALGDGIRDAIDPESEGGSEAAGGAAATGGGG